MSLSISSILYTFLIGLTFVGAQPQFGLPRKNPEILETQPYLRAGSIQGGLSIESSTKLRWLNGATMQIIWPMGSKDLIFLTETSKFCEFSGSFENDFHAEASIIGCINGDETKVNIEIQNEPIKKFILKNGITFEENI